MGQAWCKEKSSKAQDSKSPLDRVFLRCAHTIYPGLKEEGSVLGGATQRVTSSEIGYAGSPPRGALTRGRSIDSVDRPFHPSEWVDVNLEVPGTPRTSALTNLTTHAKLYSASTTAISTGSNKGKNEVPVPPPRQKRKKVTPAGRPLPPKPDDEFHRFRENIINNNNNNNIQHGGNRGNNNNNRNVSNKATSDCNIKDEDFKSLESSNEEDPLYSSVKSLKSNPRGGGDDVENVVSDDIGDNDNDNEGDDDDNDDEGVAGDERVAGTKGRIIRSNSIGSSLESKSRCCSSGTKVNANEDVKASTCTSESTAATPVTAVAAATVATTTGACTADAAVAATTTDSTMTTTLTSTKDVYEHKINGTGKIIPSELVSLRTRRNSDREYEKFCRSHSAEESSTPKKESADKSNLNNCNSPNYVDLDEILKTKNSARRLTAEMKAKSSLDSKKDEKVEEKEKDFSNSEILCDENFSEDGKFEERDIGDKREVEGKKECDSFFLHQPKIVSEMMKPEGEFEASSFDDKNFPDTPISRISRTISEESLPREMLLEEVEEEPVAEKKSDLKIEKPRNRRNPFLDENEEKNDSPISEEKIEAQILENDHSVLLKVLKSGGQNEDNCNPSNLSSMTPSLHEFEADLSDLLEKEEKCNDVPGLGIEKYELEDSLDKLIEPKIVKGSGSTRSNFEISGISKITDEVDGKSGHEGISGNEGEKRKNIENAAFEDVDLTENSNSEEKVSKFQVDSGESLLPSEEFHRIGNSHFFVDNKDEEKRKINLNSKKEEEEKKAKEEAFTEETIPPEKPNRLHRYNIAEIVPTPPKRKNRSFPKMHCETEENKKDSNPFENDRLI